MFILSLILVALLLVFSILAFARRFAKQTASPLRCGFSLLDGALTMGVVLFYFENAYVTLQYYQANGLYAGENILFLRLSEAILSLICLLIALVCEFTCRFRPKKTALAWVIGLGSLLAIGAVSLTLVSLLEADYAEYMTVAVVGVVLFGIVMWTNFLLSFEEGWQRIGITVANALPLLIKVGAVVWVVKIGMEQAEETSADLLSVVAAAVAMALFLAPSAVNVVSVIADHIKKAQE